MQTKKLKRSRKYFKKYNRKTRKNNRKTRKYNRKTRKYSVRTRRNYRKRQQYLGGMDGGGGGMRGVPKSASGGAAGGAAGTPPKFGYVERNLLTILSLFDKPLGEIDPRMGVYMNLIETLGDSLEFPPQLGRRTKLLLMMREIEYTKTFPASKRYETQRHAITQEFFENIFSPRSGPKYLYCSGGASGRSSGKVYLYTSQNKRAYNLSEEAGKK